MKVEKGVTLIFGPNGSGKSTLISIMEGLLPPTSGTIYVLGLSPERYSREIMNRVAFLPERPQYFGSNNVADYLYWIMNIGRADKSNMKRLIDRFDIEYLINRSFSQLSLGEMQLVSLVAVLSLDRQYFVLDELNANLDPSRRIVLSTEIAMMKKNGKSFLISTHIIDELISIVDRTIIMSKGSVKKSLINKPGESGNQFSLYISSTNSDMLMDSLNALNPKRYGDFVVVDGHNIASIMKILNDVERESLISAFSYPRMTFDE
jgi:ABC-type multidrug transport system ATPase subunit